MCLCVIRTHRWSWHHDLAAYFVYLLYNLLCLDCLWMSLLNIFFFGRKYIHLSSHWLQLHNDKYQNKDWKSSRPQPNGFSLTQVFGNMQTWPKSLFPLCWGSLIQNISEALSRTTTEVIEMTFSRLHTSGAEGLNIFLAGSQAQSFQFTTLILGLKQFSPTSVFALEC